MESTFRLAIGTLASLIGALVAGGIWLGAIDSKAKTTEDRVERIAGAYKEIRDKVDLINTRTIRMETILEELKNKKPRGF